LEVTSWNKKAFPKKTIANIAKIPKISLIGPKIAKLAWD